MKHRRLIGISLSLALVLALSAPALATAPAPVAPPPGSHTTVGNSTISIMTAAVDPKNVSFTVPLYVTLAVVASDPDVKVPDNYKITNTSNSGNVADAYKIGVTAMSFEKLDGSSFSTVTNPHGVVTGNDNIYLTIGGLDMPELTIASTSPVTLTGAGSAFVNAGHPTAIAVNESLPLTITGTVAEASREATATVAQFRVTYTISLLKDGTTPLGLVYAGNDSAAAGLGPEQ